MEEIERTEVSVKLWLLNRKANWNVFLKRWVILYGSPSTAWWWDWYQKKGYRGVNCATYNSDTSGKANSS